MASHTRPSRARRSLRVGLVRDIFDTVTRSKECFLTTSSCRQSIEPCFNTRHLDTGQRPRSCANDRRVRQRGGARSPVLAHLAASPLRGLGNSPDQTPASHADAFSAIEVLVP